MSNKKAANSNKKSTSKQSVKIISRANIKPYLFSLFVAAGLLVMIVSQGFLLANLNRKIDDLNKSMGGVIDEVGKKLTIAEQLEYFGSDLNEIRKYLYLPTKSYSFSDDEVVVAKNTEESVEVRYNQGLFMALEEINLSNQKSKISQQAVEKLNTYLNNQDYIDRLAAFDLVFGAVVITEGDLIYLPINFKNRSPFARLTFHSDTGEWELYSNAQAKFYKDSMLFEEALEDYFATIDIAIEQYNQRAALLAELDNYLKTPTVKEALEAKAAKIENYIIFNNSNDEIAKIIFNHSDYSIELVNGDDVEKYLSLDGLKAALPDYIQNLDTRSSVDKRVDEKKDLLTSLIKDDAFQEMLNEYGLFISGEPRYEDDRLYYAITNKAGDIVKSIIIERNASAEILLVDSEGLNPVPLQDFANSETLKKKLKFRM